MSHKIPRPGELPPTVAPVAPRAAPPAAIGYLLTAVLCLAIGAGGGYVTGKGWVGLPSVVSGPVIAENGSGVLIIHNNQDDTKASGGQLAAMNSWADDSARAFVVAKGGVYRVLDKDDAVDQETAVIQAAWKLDRKGERTLVAWKGRKTLVLALPEKEADTIAALKKFMGS